MQQTGDPVASRQLTIGSLEQLRDQQALSLAYFDVYFVSAALASGLVFLLLLMRRSVAEKGAHIAAD
jgi:DHA2 family multidrug resistance protein